MSSVWGQVKERMRSRSRSRKAQSWQQDSSSRPVTSGTDVLQSEYSPNDADEAAPAPSVPRVSADNTAFHKRSRAERPTSKYGRNVSEEQRGREVVALRDMLEQRRHNPDDQSVLQNLVGTMVPDRSSSKKPRSRKSKSKSHSRHVSQPVTQSDQDAIASNRDLPVQEQPNRLKSGHMRNFSQPFSAGQRDIPPRTHRVKNASQKSPSSQINGSNAPTGTHNEDDDSRNVTSTVSHDAPHEQGKALYTVDGTPDDLKGPDNGLVIPERSRARDSTHKPQIKSDSKTNPNLRLPEGFKLQNGVNTKITETWQPAVTRENVYRYRKEIVREEITREIHVHHYYTYLQPIKVVEVLPPKHYMIDQHTGWKIEIPQPEGWIMPESMKPAKPDYSMVKGWTRHYLVNDENPTGIPESPPLRREQNYSNLRERARSMSG